MNFDEKAQTWDSEDRALRAVAIAGEIEAAITGETYHKALEFGCGTGLVSFNLQHLLREMVLVDNSTEMIRVLKTKIQSSGIRNMTANTMDIMNGDPLPGRYDFVYTSMALHHIPDTRKLLHIFSEHMDEDGLLCIVDLMEEDGSFHKTESDFTGHNGFNPEHLKTFLEKSGFKDITSKTFYEGAKKSEEGDIPYSLFLITAKRK